MKCMDGIKILIAVLVLAGFVDTGDAAVSLSNSGGGAWKSQRDNSIKKNSETTLTDYQVLIELNAKQYVKP